MDIILWRHAEAEIGEPHLNLSDLKRNLTEKGKRQAKKMAKRLKKRLPEAFDVYVSQAHRSQQTGAYLAQPTAILASLNPEESIENVVSVLNQFQENQTVVIVGHQPWIGQFCGFLLNGQHFLHNEWSVKKGAFWWFQVRDGRAKLKLMMTPNDYDDAD